MTGAAEWALLGVGIPVYVYWLYQMIIAAYGIRLPPRSPAATSTRRMAVVIPAHNEERVIGFLLDSLLAQTYPADRFDVFVSCDACTDRTSIIAAEKGAQLLARDARGATGKTANLRWALSQLALNDYEAIAIFDADNLVDRTFLSSMNDFLAAHPDAEAVQGWLDVKNPFDSWITRVYALAFWYANRFWQTARERAGLSVNLGGTGEVLRVEMLKREGWDWTSVTDDLELTCRIVLEGGRVRYNPYAIAFDEKPITERASHVQRARWLRGHYAALVRYGPRLLKFALQGGGLRPLDLGLHLLIPGRATMSYMTMFGGLAIVLARTALRPAWVRDDPLAWTWLLLVFASLTQCALVLVIAPSFRARRVTFRYLPDAVSYLRYGLRSLPTFATSLAQRNTGWSRTEHTRSVGLDNVEETRSKIQMRRDRPPES